MKSNLFNAMFEQSAIAMVISKIDGKILYVNHAFCELMAYSNVELKSKTIYDISHPDDVAMNQNYLEKLLSGEISHYQIEKRYIRKSNEVVWAFLSVNLIYDDNGTPQYLMGQIQDLTEKKGMEQKLREKERKYRLITENSSDCIITVTPEGKYMYISPSLEMQLGYKISELKNTSLIDLLYENDQPLLKKAIQVVKNSNLSIIVTYRIRHKLGHYLWNEANIKCMDEEIGMVLVTCREITERKEMEMKLQLSNQKVNNILESISDGFFSLDEDDRFIYVNQSALKLLNSRKEQIIGYRWLDLFPQYEKSELTKNYFYVKSKKVNVKFDMYFDFLDSWFTVRMYHLKNVVSIYMLNITKQKKLENKLIESEERYRSLVELSPETISVFADEKVVFTNPAGLKLLGAEKEEDVIGKLIWDFFPNDEHEMLKELMDEVFQNRKKSNVIEHKYMRLDGTLINVAATITSINYDGNPAIQAIVRDITEVQKMEEWMRKTEKLSLVGQLAAGVAHEIRNPMTTVKGFIQLAKTSKHLKETYIDLILAELNRTETIIYEFLALAKPNETTTFKMKNITTILMQVIQLLDAQALICDVQIDYEMQEDAYTLCDENQLKQVFINIIQNAIEACKPKSMINIFIKQDHQFIYIQIKDEGCGISSERLKRLGEPFYSTKEKGTGLGLLVTYKIIEAHNGKLNFESELGKGTTVEISLPKIVDKEQILS